jgi:putative ABC transport system permease protein
LVQGDSPGAFRLKAPGDAVPAAAVKAVRDSKELRSVPVWQATVKTEGDTQDHRKLIAVAKESGFGRYVDEAGRIPAGSAVPEAWRAGPLDTTVVAADGTRHVLRGGGESSLITKLSDSGDFVVSPDTLRSLVPDPAVATLWIDPAGGKDTKAARKVLDKVLMPFPEVRVEAGANQAEYYRDLIQKAGLVVGVLLGFSLLIAALGIATTLTLSVSERTREIGVLRAIGLTGQQLKRMLTLEAVLLALTGALAGTVLGLAFGWFAGRSLMPNAPVVFDPPYLVILGLLALTVLIGLAASVLPARRIRRMPVVDALAEQ